MAVHHSTPLDAALAVIPTLPRPLLSRLVTRMIQHLDELDGECDSDEDDTEDAFAFSRYARAHVAESGPGCYISDAGGGNVEDEGENIDAEDASGCGTYGIDQSTGPLSPYQSSSPRSW